MGGQRHTRENEAQKSFALLLIELLTLSYGSGRNALSDAQLIMSRAFVNAPHAVLEFEALRSARWRKHEHVPAIQNEIVRQALWLNLDELAGKLENAAS